MSGFPKLYEERTIRVFVARGGKKFFTREAARRRGAWDLIKTKCVCRFDEESDKDGAEGGTIGKFIRCKYHQDYNDYELPEYQHLGWLLHTKIIARAKREEKRAKDARRVKS